MKPVRLTDEPLMVEHQCWPRPDNWEQMISIQVAQKPDPNRAPAVMIIHSALPMVIDCTHCPFCGKHLHTPARTINWPKTATTGPVRDSGPKFAVGQYRGENEQVPSPNLHLFVDQRAIDLGPEFPVEGGHYPDVAITIEGAKLIYHVRNPDTGFSLTGELEVLK